MDDIILNPDTYDPKPLPRDVKDTFCPHCNTSGEPTNHYLYKCTSVECGRYW
jgi:hypothetical protein